MSGEQKEKELKVPKAPNLSSEIPKVKPKTLDKTNYLAQISQEKPIIIEIEMPPSLAELLEKVYKKRIDMLIVVFIRKY